MIEAILEYNFLQNAIFSAILASIVCGIIGTIIIEKRLVMMSGGIAHASFGGIGLGYWLNIEPIFGALLFSVLSALGVVKLRAQTNTNSDALMGIFWAVGMSLGVLFISFTPGYPPDISSYLFGDILTVTDMDLKIMLLLDILVFISVFSLYNYWKAYLFDEEFLKVKGIKTVWLEYFLFVLIALSVIVLIRVVGIVLVIALLTAPPALAKMYTYNLKKMMLTAVILGLIFSLTGLVVSYYLEIASGASIILIIGITYISRVLIGKNNKKSKDNPGDVNGQ